jgi:acyl-CoA dehydrogenase
MNAYSYLAVMGICGIARMYADNHCGADLCGTNEIMKILIARGLFKDMLK